MWLITLFINHESIAIISIYQSILNSNYPFNDHVKLNSIHNLHTQYLVDYYTHIYIYIYIYPINYGVVQGFPVLRKAVTTHVKKYDIFSCAFDIANHLLTRHSPFAPLTGQVDE